jgi:hypothetical protein
MWWSEAWEPLGDLAERNPNRPIRAVSSYRLLNDEKTFYLCFFIMFYFIILFIYFSLCKYASADALVGGLKAPQN